MAARVHPGSQKPTGVDGTGYAHREHRSKKGREKQRLQTFNLKRKKERVLKKEIEQQDETVKELRRGKSL